MSAFGDCKRCPEEAIVKLNGEPLCVEHFEAAMVNIGDTTRRIVSQLVDPQEERP